MTLHLGHGPRASLGLRRRGGGVRKALLWLMLALTAIALSAHAAPNPASKGEAEARANRDRAQEALRKVEAAKPGPERYKLVDAVIEIGDDAWPLVALALPRLGKLVEGEAVVVDLLLGFMPTSYDALVSATPKLSDEAAWRTVRFVLRLPEDPRQTQLLASLLPRQDERILLAVAPPLVAREHPDVFPRLVEAIDESRPQLAAFAVDILAAHRYEPALPSLIRLFGIEQRRAAAANLPMRIKLINAIARVGGEPVVPALMEGLVLADQRRAIKEGLQQVGPPAVRAALFQLKTASGQRLVLTLELLAFLRSEAAPEIATLLGSGDAAVRELAIDVLTYLGVADVRPQVAQAIRDRQVGDLSSALRLVSSLYDDEVRKLLFDLLASPDPTVRLAGVEALWRLRDPKTFRVLRVLAAQDRDNEVRIAAIRAVAGSGDPEGMPLLRRMVQVPDHALKLVLIEAIARADRWDLGVTALLPLLADPDDAVFRATLAALERMTLHSGPRSAGQWRGFVAAQTRRAKEPFEQIVPDELRFVVSDREMSVMLHGEDEPTLVFLSGPPFRDSTHLLPWALRLADDHRVALLRRAPWPYRAARDGSERQRQRELDALLQRVGARRVVLVADVGGAALAMRYAAGHSKEVAAVVLLGGPWPTAAALERLLEEVPAAMGPAALTDWRQGLAGGWRVEAKLARAQALRGLAAATLGVSRIGLDLRAETLCDDAFDAIALERLRAELVDFDPSLTPQPVLVVLGDKAPWSKSSKAEIEALEKARRGKTRVVVIPGAGAMPLAEKPEATRAAIAAFLDD